MDTQASKARLGGAGAPRANWANLIWKTLLVVAIVLLMSVGNPLSWFVAWGFLNPVPATLLLWGFLLAGIASNNLFEGTQRSRLIWTLLTVAAYGALTIPGVLIGPERTVDALGPVAALTLAAQLGRRDLPRALRDWALVLAVALYSSLGVQAMWLVVNSFSNTVGPLVLLVLLPPLIFEAVSLVIRRIGRLGNSPAASVVSLILATSLGVVVFSLTMFNVATDPLWRAIFGLLVGVLIGGALLIGLLTRPLVSAASGSRAAPAKGFNLARTLVELSHEPILIALALYIPLRLAPNL
jgi:hypothetical protein